MQRFFVKKNIIVFLILLLAIGLLSSVLIVRHYKQLGKIESQPAYGDVQIYKSIVKKNNGTATATTYASIGSKYSQLKDYKQAIKYYLKAKQLNSDQTLATGSSYNMVLAFLYTQVGDKKNAIMHYNMELERISNDPDKDQYSELKTAIESKIRGLKNAS